MESCDKRRRLKPSKAERLAVSVSDRRSPQHIITLQNRNFVARNPFDIHRSTKWKGGHFPKILYGNVHLVVYRGGGIEHIRQDIIKMSTMRTEQLLLHLWVSGGWKMHVVLICLNGYLRQLLIHSVAKTAPHQKKI